MFGLGKSSAEKPSETEAAQGDQIHYHPELISELINQQSRIYESFKSLVSSLKQGSFSEIETTLVTFKRGFHAYLMEKNVKLFSYLKHSANLDASETMAVNNSRTMNTQVSRRINRFIETYLDEGKLSLEDAGREEFELELKSMGKEMIAAMRDERENLFPVYEKQVA